MSQGEHIASARSRLSALRASLQRDIVRLLDELDSKGGELVGTQDALSNAVRVRSQILDLLRSEGAPVALSIAEKGTEEAAAEVLRKRNTHEVTRDAPGGQITTQAEAHRAALAAASGTLDDLPSVWADAADEIRQAIDRATVTGGRVGDLRAAIAERLQVAQHQSEVVMEAAIRGAVTKATILDAERAARETGDPMGYLYDGPEDSKTRPFCDGVVGKVYTLAALRRLDNGQGLPVETHRGGYRCRHRLSPIPLDDAEAEGYEVVR
jgi:hypothetical protein